MKKILLVIGDAVELLDTMYPYFRIQEAGHQVVVAAPEKRRYHMVQHERPEDWDITQETAGYHLERARILGMRNEVEAAVAEFQLALGELRQKDEKKLVVVYDSKALAEYSIATLLEGAGNSQKARDAYGRALQEDLAYYPAHVRLGLLQLSEGDTTAAMSELALASDIATDDPYVHYMNGWVLGKAKHTAEAVAELTKATKLEPYYALPNLVLGAQYETLEKAPEAIAATSGISPWPVRAIHSAICWACADLKEFVKGPTAQ